MHIGDGKGESFIWSIGHVWRYREIRASRKRLLEDIPQLNSRYVRTLLVVVIGLGVLLVVGAIVVIGLVIKRFDNPETVPVEAGFGETEMSIPASGQLLGVENGDTRIIVKLKTEDGPLLILLDPRKGEETGRVRL